MFRRIIIGAFLTLAISVSTASAQEMILLGADYVKKLNEKALPVYQEGVVAFDHVNYDRALIYFFEAMKRDPKHVKLRLLVGRFAMQRASVKHGEDAQKYLSVAREAYSGLLALESLKPEDRRRAETDLSQVRSLIADVPKRDTRREATGKAIIDEIKKEREAFTGLKPLGLSNEETPSTANNVATAPPPAPAPAAAPAPAPNGYFSQEGVDVFTK